MGVLVIGGTGLVGNALVRAWQARGTPVSAATYHCHPSPDFRRLDMTDAGAVEAVLAELRPEVVAVPAANPFVDYCELHPEETRRTNVDGTLNVARACAASGARMIFFSSDYVFDGKKGSYTEEDAVSPINEYGRQKAAAEAGVLAAGSGNLVIRTSGAYGWQWEPKNFVLQVLAKGQKGEAMQVADDLEYNPTYTENLARIVVELTDIKARGIYHVVGAERINRYAFARKAAEAFGLDAAFLSPTSSKKFNPPAPRPKASSLVTDKVYAAVATKPLTTGDGLAMMKRDEPAWRSYAKRLPLYK